VRRRLERYRYFLSGIALLSLTAGTLMTPPHRVAAGTSSGWSASVSLSVFSRGKWLTPTNSNVDSLSLSRVRLDARGHGVASPHVVTRLSMSHVTWQGSQKLIMAPGLETGMKRTSAAGPTATFETVVRIPTMLPGGGTWLM